MLWKNIISNSQLLQTVENSLCSVSRGAVLLKINVTLVARLVQDFYTVDSYPALLPSLARLWSAQWSSRNIGEPQTTITQPEAKTPSWETESHTRVATTRHTTVSGPAGI